MDIISITEIEEVIAIYINVPTLGDPQVWDDSRVWDDTETWEDYPDATY